ncbi:hypothetical protein EC991_009917 [Linnemannia zychae]|nr:hypothetical protein EC991_009917 [Linnemannia zychae]
MLRGLHRPVVLAQLYKKAIEGTSTNAKCDDETLAINHWPGDVNPEVSMSNQPVHTESDVDVDDYASEFIAVDENASTGHMDLEEIASVESVDAIEIAPVESTIQAENAELPHILKKKALLNKRPVTDVA